MPPYQPPPHYPQQQQAAPPQGLPLPPPVMPYQPSGPAYAGGVACPRCGQAAAYQPGFTWWGGALGPKLFNHHVCRACRYAFNGKTGRPNTTGIAIYVAVSVVLGLVLGYFVFSYMGAM